jgi:predicted house-cleaning noncanonical NTP pyrophosphatase (MazG superfamily)
MPKRKFRFTGEKLVRDKIPVRVRRRGEKMNTRVASREEYLIFLLEKAIEESTEMLDAAVKARKARSSVKRAVRKESADLQTVQELIWKRLNISRTEITAEQRLKQRHNGGFEKRLIWCK